MSRHDFLSLGDEIDANAANGIPNGAPTVTNIAQRFTGQVRDRETAPALDYFQARYYSTAIARFTSVDPGNFGADLTNPQSWNGYAYVLGNPLNGRDPTGMDCVTLDNGSTGDVDGLGAGAPDVSPVWGLSGDRLTVAPIALGRTGVPTISASPAQAQSQNRGNTAAPSSQKPSFVSCTFNAKTGRALGTTALDAVGIIPGGWNVLHAIQFGAAIGAARISVYGSVRDGGLSATGAGLAIADKTGVTIAVHGSEVIPILGNAISAVATGFDIFGEGGVVDSYTSCLAGTHP